MNRYVGLDDVIFAEHFEHAFISVNRLRNRRKAGRFRPRRWIMDSGAFTEISNFGEYRAGRHAVAVRAQCRRAVGSDRLRRGSFPPAHGLPRSRGVDRARHFFFFSGTVSRNPGIAMNFQLTHLFEPAWFVLFAVKSEQQTFNTFVRQRPHAAETTWPVRGPEKGPPFFTFERPLRFRRNPPVANLARWRGHIQPSGLTIGWTVQGTRGLPNSPACVSREGKRTARMTHRAVVFLLPSDRFSVLGGLLFSLLFLLRFMNPTPDRITVDSLGIDVSKLPILLDEDGIRERLCPIGRSTLYAAATNGDLQTVLLGAPGKRGKRLFLASSVVEWILKRANATARPNISPRKRKVTQ